MGSEALDVWVECFQDGGSRKPRKSPGWHFQYRARQLGAGKDYEDDHNPGILGPAYNFHIPEVQTH